MNRRSFSAMLVTTVLCSAPLAAQDSSLAAPGTFVLRAAHLIDGTGSAEVQNAAVVVIGDSITWVGSAANVKAPAGARTIDLGDATLLPGFIDAHVHLAGRELGDPQADEAAVHDYDQYSAILGVNHAKSTLLDGFTSVRNVGAPNFDDMALRKAINENQIWGPRMENAGYAIGITGGRGCSTAASRRGSPMDPIRCAPPCGTWSRKAPT
jgi:imidazolonepropionase-like amidohydrolase